MSFKVICIDASNGGRCSICGSTDTYLSEGSQYIASQCPLSHSSYDIHEFLHCTCGRLHSYRKTRFIPLSTIDEKEFERNYQTQSV